MGYMNGTRVGALLSPRFKYGMGPLGSHASLYIWSYFSLYYLLCLSTPPRTADRPGLSFHTMLAKKRVSLLGISLFAVLTVQNTLTPDINEQAVSCRCTPDQPCWPKDDDWAALNSTIEGNLATLKPLAYPCHSPNFNAAECAYIQSNAHNSSYRALQPGAMQYENWGSDPARGEQCYVASPRFLPCGQGRIPLYSAAVKTARHIQAVVKFAAKHNVKLAIKNTGHDFLGRSTAPSSLQIFTGNMKEIDLTDSFVPAVPTGTAPPRGVRAVTVDAGVQLGELYEYLGAKGAMVVGGFSRTVGMAGGYIQGGGHSAMGWLYGMASDNALEFQVVLADVWLLIVSVILFH